MFRRKYFDYAAQTPVLIGALLTYLRESFFTWHNPSSIHYFGDRANKKLFLFKKEVSKILNCKAEEIIFTSGGTESANLAILGIAKRALQKIPRPRIIVSGVEHPAVEQAVYEAESLGCDVVFVGPNKDGLISPDEIKKVLNQDTVLVSVIYVQNENGVVEPIKEIGRMIKLWKKENKIDENEYPYFHTDASQAQNFYDLDKEKIGVHLMTLDSSKSYGPKGVGVLYKKNEVDILPQAFGGGQENGFRSGTQNIPGIAGFVYALKYAVRIRAKQFNRLEKIKLNFEKKLKKIDSKIVIVGEKTARSPSICQFCYPKLNGEFAVIIMDKMGYSVSRASACASENKDGSIIVGRIPGLGEDLSNACIRVSFGINTKPWMINSLVNAIEKAIKRSIY